MTSPNRTHPSMVKSNQMRKFVNELLAKPHSECVVWPFGTSGSGYPRFRPHPNAGQVEVHRHVCRAVHGDPPKGKPWALHSCSTKHCISPACLRWGSRSDNEIDKLLQGETTQTILDVEKVRRIRSLHAAGGVTYLELATMFSVSTKTIGQVCRRETWGFVA